MKSIIKLSTLLLILTGLVFSCSEPVKYDRPRDTWAFRSVIDLQPRMFTLALNKDLFVTYSLEKGKIYKAWKGKVNFDGAVYTTAHGIQPTTEGYPFIEDNSDGTSWELSVGDQKVVPTVKYVAYSKIKGQAAIDFRLTDDKGNSVLIRQIPEYALVGGNTALKIDFEILETEGSAVPSLNIPYSEETIGDQKAKGGDLKMTQGSLHFGLNSKESSLTLVFNAPPPGWKPKTEETLTRVAVGKKLMEQSDCKTCHLEHENLVGPAYDSIAKRYDFSWSITESLAQKIINGGSGNWGAIQMTAHDISSGDARDMAYYILSLDGEDEPDSNGPDLYLGKKSILIDFNDTNYSKESYTNKQGVIANFYEIEGAPKLVGEPMKGKSPIFNAIASQIHVTGQDKVFDKGALSYYVDVIGQIKMDKPGKKYFRLISDDGSRLLVNGKEVIDNGGYHAPTAKDGSTNLKKGNNNFTIQYFDGGGGNALSFQWSDDGITYSLVPAEVLFHNSADFKKVMPFVAKDKLVKNIPGDARPLSAVHPSFDVFDAKPDEFHPRIGGIDFISKDEMVICTWDSAGSVYILKNYNTEDPSTIEVKQIASGLAEPLGIKYIDGELFVLQKQELTQLIDKDGDQIIDEYKNISNVWHTTSHYHEFAFGLVYKEGNFYATLATDLGEQYKNVPQRGKVVRISKDGSEFEIIAGGFRTPNGISEGPDGALYVSDNQGNWIPTSKIVRVEKGGFYGFKFADYDIVKDKKEDPPLIWLPHVEISNSPSQQAILNLGPYKDQMIHGDVTHGGIKRVFIDEVDGTKQGVVFRFIQGLDAGINRIMWGPDGSLYAGGVGSGGNWRHEGRLWYALHRFDYNEKSTFEMLAVRAKTNGMEIELTEPIAENEVVTKESFESSQYYYVATSNYGGPKMGTEVVNVKSATLSEDRKKIFLEMDGLKEGYVVYIRIKKPFISESNKSLWSTESWYTLTKKPANNPGAVNPSKVNYNTLSEKEKADGWKLLFDGKSKEGWTNFNKETVGNKWVVTKNGELHLTEKGGGDLVTKEQYENYELSLEWKLIEGGNSGLIFNVVQDPKYKYPWQTGPEMQMLDNAKHPDGRYVTHRAGDLYDMIESKYVTANPGGDWNKIRFIVKDGKVEHWQNGYKIVEYTMFGDEWKEMIANSKFKNMEDFGKARKGHIAIQDHGDKLWLRNVKIKEL